MNETQIKELRAHAGKLVAEGKSLSGVFEYYLTNHNLWVLYGYDSIVPNFSGGNEWRIAKPKKQLIDWSHPYFKGCATNCGELLKMSADGSYITSTGNGHRTLYLRLAAPVKDDSNWQPFFSTQENDTKLRELAKMVMVEVRYWDDVLNQYEVATLIASGSAFVDVGNFRITGLQDGWTDNPEDV